MFYAHFVLAKKGPLARIWLAAHWDKKLTKAHVYETNIESSVEGILQPKVKMALRTSGHLLLGIVRIYSRKAKYLLADCNEAFIKIKMAFRPGVVDLPEENRAAAVATITLPDVFHDFDSAMPDLTIDMDAQVTLNQSRAEDITMKEDYGTLCLIADDGFEDMGFDDNETGKDSTSIDEEFDQTTFLLCEAQSKQTTTVQSSNNGLDTPLKDDGFGGTVGEGLLDSATGGLFEPTGLFDDAPLRSLENNSSALPCENPAEDSSDSNVDMYEMGSVGAPSIPSSPAFCLNTDIGIPDSETAQSNRIDSLDFVDTQLPSTASGLETPTQQGDTHLITNEGETFALAPLDTTFPQGIERICKAKRKRKLIVDEVKNISGEEMKSQLSDTADIVTPLDLAPPSKRLMHWKETGSVEKLFSLPGHTVLSHKLCDMYSKRMNTQSIDVGDFNTDSINLDTDIEQGRHEEIEKRRDMSAMLPHLENVHLDPFATNHVLSSLEVPNFLHHNVFPQNPSSVIPNVMPSVPPHIMHQILQEDVTHLSIPPLIEQSTSHSVMTVQSAPMVCDTYNHHPESQNLLPDSYVPQHRIEKQMKMNHSMDNLMNLQPQQSAPTNCMPYLQSELHPCSDSHIDTLQNDEMTILEDPSQISQTTNEMQLVQIPDYLDSQDAEVNPQIPASCAIENSPSCVLSNIATSEEDNPKNTLPNSDMDHPEPENGPSSTELLLPEEQMADETYEQFEERMLTKRTTHMLHVIQGFLNNGQTVSFADLVKNMKRKQVAQKFYTLLVLKKQQAVELKQNSSFADMFITKGPRFDDVYISK